MRTFKININKFDSITDEELQSKARGEMYDLAYDKIYYIDAMGIMNFMTMGAWFEAMEYGETEFYYTAHNKESEDAFYNDYKLLVSHIVEIVDREEEIESKTSDYVKQERRMKPFNNLKKWLKNNNIYFEKGFSEADEETEVHDFVIIPSMDLQIYNDQDGLTLDYGDNEFETFDNNKSLYKEIKAEIAKQDN